VLTEVLNRYLSSMTDIAFDYRGTLDKYIGDAMVVIYGAPLDDPDHPLNALSTGVQMMRTLPLVRAHMQKHHPHPGLAEMDIGIGVNTGDAVIGNFGSGRRFDYTAIGDVVNLASRLESLNRMYGTHILTSAESLSRCGEKFLTREIDYVAVKGRTGYTELHEVREFTDSDFSDQEQWLKSREQFAKALTLYRTRDFEGARRIFEFQAEVDSVSRVFLNRSQWFLQNPPSDDWDGTWVMAEK